MSSHAILSDPSWYLCASSQKTPWNITTNAVFLVLSYYYWRIRPIPVLSVGLFLLFLGSSLFHIHPKKWTLFLDRLAMIIVFSKVYETFHPAYSWGTYFVVGLATLVYWDLTDEILYYYLYQALGVLLFLLYYIGVSAGTKWGIALMTVAVQLSQLIRKGQYHGWKHILLGGILLIII